MAVRNFRSILKTTGPMWLRIGTNLSIMYGIGVILDLIADMALAAVRRRFANEAIPDALDVIGAERGIWRGPSEDRDHYVERLKNWLPAVRRKGGTYEMLNQLHAYFEQWEGFQIDLVYANGRRYTKDAAGAITYDDLAWTPPIAGSHRWFMYLRPSQELPISTDDLRALLREWNAVHAIGTAYILVNGAHVWGEPGLTWGAPGLVWPSSNPTVLTEIAA